MKKCNKCHEEFPSTREFFHADKKTPDGLYYRCKKCTIEDINKYRKDMEVEDEGSVNIIWKRYISGSADLVLEHRGKSLSKTYGYSRFVEIHGDKDIEIITI